MEYTDFEILKVAHISRFFFASENMFEDKDNGLGRNWEYIMDHKSDISTLRSIIFTYSPKFQDMTGEPFREFVCRYINTCKLHESKEFWMGLTKNQRRKFCIFLLSRILWKQKDTISYNKQCSFGLSSNEFYRLINNFYPNGHATQPSVDPIVMAMLQFEVIPSFNTASIENSRRMRFSLNKEKTSIRGFLSLLSLLKDSLPANLPNIVKKNIIDDIDAKYNFYSNETIASLEPGSPGVAHWLTILRLGKINTSNAQPIHLNMNGVWKDNKNFMWIFPNDNQFALRFEYSFPLRKIQLYLIEQIDSTVVDSKSTHWIFHNVTEINPNTFICGSYKECVENNKASLSIIPCIDEKGNVAHIEFDNMKNSSPEWCNWNRFSRIPSKDASLLKESLLKLSKESKLSRLGEEISNPDLWHDTMIAVDKEYVYLSDQWQQATPLIECNEKESFLLKWKSDETSKRNLFSLDISPNKPLYIIPRHPLGENINWDFRDAIEQLDWGKVVHILHKTPDGIPRLYFPNFYVAIPLDEDTMKLIGIRKVTHSSNFFIKLPE